MIIANEARIIAKDVLIARDNERKLAARDWAERCASPEIEKAAQAGKFYVRLEIHNLNVKYVQDVLENNGYKTKIFNDNVLRIEW